MADADRLQAIQEDFDRALEARITELMATVQAAREINRQLQQAEGDIALHEADIDATREELDGLQAGSDAHEEGLARIEALQAVISEMGDIRDELTEALAGLVGELDA